MKKGFLIVYLVLSIFVFFTGIQAVFSNSGKMVMRDGDIATCQKSYTECTEGACTASKDFVATNCNLYECRDGDSGRMTVHCETPSHGGSGSSQWGDDCDPTMSDIYGYCVVVPPRL